MSDKPLSDDSGAESFGDASYLDTNVVIRHLTGDPPDQAAAATAFLLAAKTTKKLLLVDLVVAEIVYVLESFYERPRDEIAGAVRATLAFPAVAVADVRLLHRAIEIYEYYGLDFADAYIGAAAERSGIGRVTSFDKEIDRIKSIERIEPAVSDTE